jgi:hypothetical protein
LKKLATLVAMAALLVFVGAGFLQARTFVLPHVLEKSGRITNTQFTFDTSIFVNYVAGQGEIPAGTGATVDLFLFDSVGNFLKVGGNEVCSTTAACHFSVGGSANRKLQIVVDDLLSAKGTFNVALGYGVLVVGGDDPTHVAVQGFVVNSHTSAFDLSVFGFAPVEISAAAN